MSVVAFSGAVIFGIATGLWLILDGGHWTVEVIGFAVFSIAISDVIWRVRMGFFPFRYLRDTRWWRKYWRRRRDRRYGGKRIVSVRRRA